MKNKIQWYALVIVFLMVAASCAKKKQLGLGDYPIDSNPPGGPLKFYTAFDGTTSDPLMNAVDSIKANFPSVNPFTQIDGIKGKGVKGLATKDKAIKYNSPNDFAKSTSWSISYWLKNTPTTDGEPEFHFSLASKDYWHESALFLLVEKGGPNADNSTTSLMACKLAVEDSWAEFIGPNRLPNVLNGQWHHLVFTYNTEDSYVRAYVDGVLAKMLGPITKNGSPRGAKPFVNTNTFILGGWNKNAGVSGVQDAWVHAYSGAMDQFRLYGKTLSDAEVLAIYNARM